MNLLSTRFISRLLLSPLIAHDALVWSMAAARLRLGLGARCRFCRRSWLRLWHALLAAMLPALILHTFKIVFFGHRDRTLFRSGRLHVRTFSMRFFKAISRGVNAFRHHRVPGLKDKEAPSWKDRARRAKFGEVPGGETSVR